MTRVGFSVSKRVGNAVTRNRCRRMMREAVRSVLAEMRAGADYVFIARGPMPRATYQRVRQDIQYVLRRAKALTGIA